MREHQIFAVNMAHGDPAANVLTLEVRRQGDLEAKKVRIRIHRDYEGTFRALLFKCYGITGEIKHWFDTSWDGWTVETVVNKEVS